MTNFTIASFNVKNLIGPKKEYYKFLSYTPEEYAWKLDWTADQLLSMDADIVGFQEVFEESALTEVIAETDRRGIELNDAAIPDHSKRYRKRVIFRKLAFSPYTDAALAFAPNLMDGKPGHRRPGLAILSRFGFVGAPVIIQDLAEPINIPMSALGGDDDAGQFTIKRLSRPILMARVPVGGQVISVFNCHLKSKLGEYVRPEGADFAPEIILTDYAAAGRAMGVMRAAIRRMGEAVALRRAVLQELGKGRPVMVLGDFNDGEHAVSSEIVSGEHPFKNYSWMLRHNAKAPNDRYSDIENEEITEAIDRVRLRSGEKMFVRKSLRDMVFTSAFGGVYESVDQIYMSRDFDPEYAKAIGEMEYYSVFNDHLTDGSHPEAPYNKLASDHGQIIAHMRI